LADPRGNSIRRSDPDRTDAVDLGSDATCLGFARAARSGLDRGDRLAALDWLATTLRAARGGRLAALGGAGGGGAVLRAICFGFGAVKAGGSGGGSGAFGGAGAAFTTDGFLIICGWTVAIFGGGGGTMAAGALTIAGGGGGTIVRGFCATGFCFLAGARRTTLLLVVGRVRFTAFLTGLRLMRRLFAVGGVSARRLFRTRLLGFEITGNLG
jgi:hypothetical protein